MYVQTVKIHERQRNVFKICGCHGTHANAPYAKQLSLVIFCYKTAGNGVSFWTHGRTHGHTDGQTNVEVEIVI